MITIGVDAHKRLHVATAVDDAGRDAGAWRGPNNRAGWQSLSSWLSSLGGERQVGIEGAWSYGRNLAQHLVVEGETVYEVNARWTAHFRRGARKPDKSDPLDARAVAMFVRQAAASLSPITSDDETSELDMLSSERDDAVSEATRLRNQIHALLMQLDPEYHLTIPTLKSAAGLAALRRFEPPDNHPLTQARSAAVYRLTKRLSLALEQADELAKRIRTIASDRFQPLTRLCGIDLLTAGTLAGILGPGQRFASDAALAAFAGVSPLEASSAGHVRHRLNRGGNRRLNAILYRIALTQAHYSPDARTYLARRLSEGKTKKEAIRALKRFIVRAVWRSWTECQSNQASARPCTT